MGGNEKDVLKEILSIVGSHKDNSYKAAIASVLTTRLINYSVYHAKDNKINQSYIDRLVALVEHEVFGKDLSFNLVNSVNFQDYEIISNADVKLLEAFINNKVNLKSFKGKVVFLQDTTFPRFKLTEYSKKNNKIIRTIKDSSADAVILDIEQVKESLKNLPEWIFLPNNDAVDSYQRTWYNSSGQYSKDAIRGRQIKDNQDYYSRRTNFDQIQHLLNLYNNYPNIKIITVQDLTQEVTS